MARLPAASRRCRQRDPDDDPAFRSARVRSCFRHARARFAVSAMFRLFEKSLDPTHQPARPSRPPDWWLSIGICPPGQRPVRRRCSRPDSTVALLDSHGPGFHGPGREPGDGERPGPTVGPLLAHAIGMAAVLLVARPLALTCQNLSRQPGDLGQCLQHDPVAEPLACGRASPGRSSRTISPAASPTACCRPGRRYANSWSR